MKKTIITSDSPIDLSAEQAKRFEIKIIPLHIILDGKDYLDGEGITPDDMYRVYNEKKILPSTSAISVAEYKDFFESFISQGYSVVHISLSSAISSTYQNAKIAAEELDDAYVFDSKRLSSGIALLAIKAAEMRDNQLSATEIVNELEIMRDKVSTSFVLDTLQFMSKGGRCSAVAAFGANILGIKPSIENFNDGTLGVSKKYRGKIDAVRLQYVKEKLDADNIDYSRIFITHSGMESESINEIKNYIEDNYNFDEIIICRAGCTVSTHCGPGTVGVLFMFN